MRALAVVGLWTVAMLACETRAPLSDLDAGRRDARASDTNTDGISVDDAGTRAGTCHFDATTDVFELDTDPRATSSRIAMAGGPTSFGVVYAKRDATGGGENVFFVEIPSASGPPQSIRQLTTGTFIETAPTITRTSAGWLIAWLSNRDGNVEVYALGSGADGQLASTPTRVTHTASIDEQSPALTSDGSTNALAWAEPGTPIATLVQAIGGDGTPGGASVRSSASGLAMVPTIFTPTDVGTLIGWADPDGDALVQPLAPDGTTMGTPMPLTTEHDTDGRIDAVVGNGGGAVVYGALIAGVRHDVHAHLVDRMGALVYAEHVLTLGADTGTDASIAEIGGGFAVAYRQAGGAPVLRVLFFDSLLAGIGRGDLVPVAPTGGPITIRTAADGNLLLTWGDVVGTTSQVRAARLRCL